MKVYSYCMDEVHDNGSHQITMEEYMLKKGLDEAFKKVVVVVKDLSTQIINERLIIIVSQWGKALSQISEKESLVEKKLELNKYPAYKNKLQYTSVNIPKKMYHRARGGLR